MAINEIHLNDVGTVFLTTILNQDNAIINISGASTLEILFEQPDGTILTKSGSLTTNGTDGKMQYASVTGDLNQVGTWRRQGHIVLSSGNWKTDIECFEVTDNL